MRRKHREITDQSKIQQVISGCSCCRIGFHDRGQVYIVPLNFGAVCSQGRYTFYFHGAKEGRKIDLIRESPEVGFEMDTNYLLNEADLACGYSARFQSVIGNGRVCSVEEPEEKRQGLLRIMEHNTGRTDWEFSDEMIHGVCVFKLEVAALSCKEHL